MITPKQLASGNWRCRVYIGKDAEGKPKYQSVTRPTEKKCLKAALELSEHYREIAHDSSLKTLGEAMDEYITSKSNLLSPATIRGYDQIRRLRFQPEMSMKLGKLNKVIIQKAINREAKKLSYKSLKNAWGLVSAVMKENKCEVPDSLNFGQESSFTGQTLEEEEIAVLICAIKGTNVELPVLLALWLGLRLSELVGLSWDAYDPEKRKLRIDTAIVRDKDNKLVEKGTKTMKSTRVLPVPDYIADILDSTPRTNKKIVTMHPNSITRRFKKICEKNNISPVRLHDLRHTNASVMCLLNIGDKYAMQRGGWSNTQTMKNIYQHTLSKGKTEADKKIDAYFTGLTAEKKRDMTRG